MRTDELLGRFVSVRISEVISESKKCRTLYFDMMHPLSFSAGQFLMVWAPGIDEVPMSISKWEPPRVGITVLNIGEATQALISKAPGDWIGVRGPFGRSFDSKCNNALVVGGGVGMAPLRPLVYRLLEEGIDTTLLIAAKTKNDLIFHREFSELSSKAITLITTTDDGSSGYKGLATEGVAELVNITEFDTLYTCGPELMMAGLHKISMKAGIGFQASLERFMKCGCGLCGTCAMDPTGDLVCLDGPVFTGKQLEKLSDFGKYYRDQVGSKKKF
ncbi:MAG: dihydroorotate dehydrogenase electron transfer subunit [Candidatus Odinarchaeota archaeon]